MLGKKSVPYPELLDHFGKDLKIQIDELSLISLKPALISDILKALNLVLWIQQLLVMLYNLNVLNYETMMRRIVDFEKKQEELETKLAGYSSSLNETNARINKIEEAKKGENRDVKDR